MTTAPKASIGDLLREAATTARWMDEDDSEFGGPNLWEAHNKASRALVRAAVDDHAPLRAALQDADSWVRGEAAAALGRLFARDAVPVLEALRQDENRRVRAAAEEALAWITGLPEPNTRDGAPTPRFAKLVWALDQHSIDFARMYAAAELAGERSAVSALRAAMGDASNSVRESAAEALAATPCPEALDGLCAATNDTSNDVRGRAIRGIAALWASERSDAALDVVLRHTTSGGTSGIAARVALARMAEHETDPARLQKLVQFVVREVQASDVQRQEAAYRVARAIPCETIASAIARSNVSRGGWAASYKRDALDACGDMADRALLAAIDDGSLSEEARNAARSWAIERGVVSVSPGAGRDDVSPFSGKWRDEAGRELKVYYRGHGRYEVKLQPRSLPADGRERSVAPEQAFVDLPLTGEAQFGQDGRLRVELRSFAASGVFAGYTLWRKGSLLVGEVELQEDRWPGRGRMLAWLRCKVSWLGDGRPDPDHPLAWLTPVSPFRRTDLPRRAAGQDCTFDDQGGGCR